MKSFRLTKTKEQIAEQKIKEEHSLEDLQEFFSMLASAQKPTDVIIENIETIEALEEIVEAVDAIVEEQSIDELTVEEKSLVDVAVESIKKSAVKESVFELPSGAQVNPDVKHLQSRVQDLQNWMSKIAMAGPGSGEVNLRWLDDVARETISDGRWLKYDDSRKKFVFDEINPFQVVNNTTEVTSTEYTVHDDDYYIGINNTTAPVTVVLPTSTNSGRTIIIKDEDGDAEIHPITVQGLVDNDPDGFIIQINNGAVQLIYRNGWRIV